MVTDWRRCSACLRNNPRHARLHDSSHVSTCDSWCVGVLSWMVGGVGMVLGTRRCASASARQGCPFGSRSSIPPYPPLASPSLTKYSRHRAEHHGARVGAHPVTRPALPAPRDGQDAQHQGRPGQLVVHHAGAFGGWGVGGSGGDAGVL